MQRLMLLLGLIGFGLVAPSLAAPLAPSPQACPADLRAALDAACPCTGFRSHGNYMHCLQKLSSELKKSGCDAKQLRRATKCAAASICGKEKKQVVVCCSKRGRAKIATAERCTSKGGTVKAGINSLCDAGCAGVATVE